MKYGNHGSAPRGGIIDYHGDGYARSRRRGLRAGGGGGGGMGPRIREFRPRSTTRLQSHRSTV